MPVRWHDDHHPRRAPPRLKEGRSSPPGPSRCSWSTPRRRTSDARLLLAGDCTAFAFASMHQEFIKDRVAVIGCPKLDDNEAYISKLSDILSSNDIQDITLVHMEVPCCGNLKRLVEAAVRRASSAATVRSYTVRRNGELLRMPFNI